MQTYGALEMLTKAQNLADAGQHAAVIELLSRQSADELRSSPTLALVLGTALARLGKLADGKHWIEVALGRARQLADARIEARALNALGAIAFEGGQIAKAADLFTHALAVGEQLSDPGIVGRCSNNLGIIANLQGHYARAVGHFTMALASFQRAASGLGVAETQHNLGIAYRDHGEFTRALDAAERAVTGAGAVGDASLLAKAWAGRAEVRVRCGDAPMARHEAETALTMHRRIEDGVGETEDLRILAATLAETGDTDGAETLLGNVMDRAQDHGRPLLVAMAARDLALLLHKLDRRDEAKDAAQTARVIFDSLGALAETKKLDTAILVQ